MQRGAAAVVFVIGDGTAVVAPHFLFISPQSRLTLPSLQGSQARDQPNSMMALPCFHAAACRKALATLFLILPLALVAGPECVSGAAIDDCGLDASCNEDAMHACMQALLACQCCLPAPSASDWTQDAQINCLLPMCRLPLACLCRHITRYDEDLEVLPICSPAPWSTLTAALNLPADCHDITSRTLVAHPRTRTCSRLQVVDSGGTYGNVFVSEWHLRPIERPP